MDLISICSVQISPFIARELVALVFLFFVELGLTFYHEEALLVAFVNYLSQSCHSCACLPVDSVDNFTAATGNHLPFHHMRCAIKILLLDDKSPLLRTV